MSHATYFNTTSSPVVIDGDGHTIAGGAWGPARSSSRQVSAALDNGSLVEVSRPDDVSEIDPAALEAFEQTDALNAPSQTAPAASRRASEKEVK